MEWRLLSLNDHDTLVEWWTKNRFTPLGLDDLPMVDGQLEGLMVSHEGVDICAGFIINTTIKNGAMIEYPVANFDVKDRELRKSALNFLIKALTEICKQMGKTYVFMSLKHPSLKQRLVDCGFVEGSIGTTEMIIQL